MEAGIEVCDGLAGEGTEAHSGLVEAGMGEGYCGLAREEEEIASRQQSGRVRKRKRNEDEADKVAASENTPPTLPGAANITTKFDPIIFL